MGWLGQGLEVGLPRGIHGPELLVVAADPIEQVLAELLARIEGVVEIGDPDAFFRDLIEGLPVGFATEQTVAVTGDDDGRGAVEDLEVLGPAAFENHRFDRRHVLIEDRGQQLAVGGIGVAGPAVTLPAGDENDLLLGRRPRRHARRSDADSRSVHRCGDDEDQRLPTVEHVCHDDHLPIAPGCCPTLVRRRLAEAYHKGVRTTSLIRGTNR